MLDKFAHLSHTTLQACKLVDPIKRLADTTRWILVKIRSYLIGIGYQIAGRAVTFYYQQAR